MLIVNNVKLPLETDFSLLKYAAAAALKTDVASIISASLYRKSVDARRRDNVHFCCTLLVQTVDDRRFAKAQKNNAELYVPEEYNPPYARKCNTRPVIAGFGPAGMFAALTLARAGLCPIVLERGASVDERTQLVKSFFAGSPLNTETNVQFGEGGAGTFSDGKLNTGIKNIRCREVLKIFAAHGAPPEILTDAKPHIGTDILCSVVKSIRNEIISLGGEIHFNTRLDGITIKNGRLRSVTAGGTELPCEFLILATGHSARDTFEMLLSKNIEIIRKPFSMGMRIEHLQADINRALYGAFAGHPALGAADYKLSAKLSDGRGIYTFCMCPGGEVINASSENGGIAVNGMSNSRRDGRNANSALLVSVLPEDIEGNNPLGGCMLQRKTEQAAFSAARGNVPVSTVGAFVFGEKPIFKDVLPTVKPQSEITDLRLLFPEFITSALIEGITLFDKKIHGFAEHSAVLTAPETRSSSPVRIVRTEELCSTSAQGLYPCGEGAGYAGGIMSAAVDGMRVAEKITECINKVI